MKPIANPSFSYFSIEENHRNKCLFSLDFRSQIVCQSKSQPCPPYALGCRLCHLWNHSIRSRHLFHVGVTYIPTGIEHLDGGMGKCSMVKEIEAVRIISPENASTTDVDKHLKKNHGCCEFWKQFLLAFT